MNIYKKNLEGNFLIRNSISYADCERVTVCPGSSDPPEKIFNIFESVMRFSPLINYYYDTLG